MTIRAWIMWSLGLTGIFLYLSREWSLSKPSAVRSGPTLRKQACFACQRQHFLRLPDSGSRQHFKTQWKSCRWMQVFAVASSVRSSFRIGPKKSMAAVQKR